MKKITSKRGKIAPILVDAHTDHSKSQTTLKNMDGLCRCMSWAAFYKLAMLQS